jgi:L-ascorbate metabolism protein UlaG (beta-lactamase superfamily)
MTKITWYGQSAYLIETGDHAILIDPWIDKNPMTDTTADSLNPDFILVSHGHGDHVGDTISIAQRTGAPVISNSDITRWFAGQGVENVSGQNIGGARAYPFGTVKLTIAHHTTMLPDGSSGGVAAGLLITLNNGQKIYFAGDTGLFLDMQLIGEEGIDLAMLPIGDNFTMGPDDAVRAVKLIKPKVVLPMHYNTFDLIKQDGEAWVDRVNQETTSKAVYLKPGDSFEI